MPKKPKPRPDITLDLFVLEMIRQGVTSLYSLKHVAGLSVGASSQTIDRLRKRGLLAVEREPSGRRKASFSLTGKGQQHLLTARRSILRSSVIPVELDSALRLACLAIFAKNQKLAHEILGKFATRHAANAILSTPEQSLGAAPDSELFRVMRALCHAAGRSAEANVLRAAAKKIGTLARSRASK